jgi:hypothetical protein
MEEENKAKDCHLVSTLVSSFGKKFMKLYRF